MNETNKIMHEYIIEQLSNLEDFRSIPMIGGYIYYYKERIFGGIYGRGNFMVKINPASKKYMPDSQEEEPYEGAKLMYKCLIVDNKKLLTDMIREMYPYLTERKHAKEALNESKETK